MPIEIPSPLVEFVLLGPSDDRRQLQDSPILGDVWIEFGRAPAARRDLLISPYRTRHSGEVAGRIANDLNKDLNGDKNADDASIAYLQGLVVASLTFKQVLSVVIPKTKWWSDKLTEDAAPPAKKTRSKVVASKSREEEPAANRKFVHEVTSRYFEPNPAIKFSTLMSEIVESAQAWHAKTGGRRARELTPFDRFSALAGLILWAARKNEIANTSSADDKIADILAAIRKDIQDVSRLFRELTDQMLADESWKKVKIEGELPLVWSVSRNRSALPAIARSVPAVKADAATTLFKINCGDIVWAVLDSGIDANHPAFKNADGKGSRVVRSFEFKNFRKIVSLNNVRDGTRATNVSELMQDRDKLKRPPSDADANEALKKLAHDARNRAPINWELVERFVELDPGKPGTKPETNHGTHVAGIIGANGKAASAALGLTDDDPNGPKCPSGMCPDILLYDFRVLGRGLEDTEFAIIAALQFIRYLNDADNFLAVHGANLSLSIPHDVRNFACGRTPICNECERLIDSGVVVVAAAGNHGYKSYQTKDGAYDSYAAFSVTDPGNADGVITVGSTHRFWPHTYGVSFFSSRGPTGDGRLKPDLVAPGERIRAPVPGKDTECALGELDGTSMAAPHVSGAAAMLLARYSELIGQPRRVKKILCDTATDLGRERSFQGRGMLDVLRALQSI